MSRAKYQRRSLDKYIEGQTEEDEPDFPGGSVVKNPPANAGVMGSIPDPGRSHVPRSMQARAPQLLSLRSRAQALQLLSHVPQMPKPASPRGRALQREKPPQRALAPQLESSLHSPQLEESPHGTEDPAQPKLKSNKQIT